MESSYGIVEGARQDLGALAFPNLNQSYTEVTGNLEFINAEALLPYIGQIDSVGKDPITERLTARCCKWVESPFDFDNDGFYIPSEVSANVSDTDDIGSSVRQAFVNCCLEAAKVMFQPPFGNRI